MRTRNSARPHRRAFLIPPVVGLAALVALVAGGRAGADTRAHAGPRPTIVLVHGDWADASSWTAVVERLQDKGFDVVAPPNTLRGPTADAKYLAAYLQSISGPIVLVAHSSGGLVVPGVVAALGDRVQAVVLIAALVPPEGGCGLDCMKESHRDGLVAVVPSPRAP